MKKKILKSLTLFLLIVMLSTSIISMVSLLYNPNPSLESKTLEPDDWIKWSSINGTYVARGVARSNDGYLYVVGYCDHEGTGDTDIFVRKFDANLNSIWTRFLGYSTGDDQGEDIAIDLEGNIIIVGTTQSFGLGTTYQLLIAKYSPTGVLLKNVTRSGNGHEVLWAVDVGPDNRYYSCGDIHYTGPAAPDDYDALYVIWNDDLSIDVEGSWLNGPLGTDRAYDIKATADSGFVIVGETESTGAGAYDGFIALYEYLGILVANETWGGSGMERFDGLVLTEESHFKAYVAAWTNTGLSGSYDASIVHYNSTIDIQWNVTYGDPLEHDIYFDICFSSDDYLYAAGYADDASSTDVLFVKYDTAGNFIDDGFWGGNTVQDAGYGLIGGSNKEIYVCGGCDYPDYTPPFREQAFLLKGFGLGPVNTTTPITSTPITSPNVTTTPTTPSNVTTTPTTTSNDTTQSFPFSGFTFTGLFASVFSVTAIIITIKRKKR
ncbi:MAG: hypothetical protein GF308_11280 [Candidatus Heimdallarchaeota archaeon]|nr:hypothetical protein [Candidatus Heimdallarchaeota archaeon]